MAAGSSLLVALLPAQASAAPAAKPAPPPKSASPVGQTKAPKSTPIGTAGKDRELVTAGILQSTFQGLGIGQVPWSEFYKAPLSDSVGAQVNHGNGNLLVSLNAFDIADAGPGLSLGHAYNGLNTSWKATTGSDYLIHEPNTTSVYVQGPSSTIAVFERDGSKFTPAPGYKQDLTESSDKKSFTLTSRKNGQKTTFTRSGTTGDARVSKVEDKNGNATTIAYSGAFTSKITAASGRTLTFTNDGKQITKVTDNTGRYATYMWSGNDLKTFTDTDGKTTVFDYDTSHRMTKVTTTEGRETRFTWDTNRLASITRIVDKTAGTGATTAFRYILPQPGSEGEGVVRITDPRGKHTEKTVDSRWRVTKTTDPLGRERSKTWGPDNNVTSAVDGMGVGSTPGNTVKFDYDDSFNPKTATQPTGAQSTMAWTQKSGGHYPETLTSASSEKVTNGYDTSGNMTSQTDTTTGSDGAKWTYDHNPRTGAMDCGGLPGQRCSATDPEDHKTSFTYDSKGNLTKVDRPSAQGDVTYTYDDLGRTDTVTDGRGVTTVYTYDKRDRLKTQTSDGKSATFTYDADGNIKTRTTPTGISSYTYDEQNRERTRTLPAGGTSSVTYDEAGNVKTATDTGGTLTYDYNDANQLTTLTQPGGAKTTYDYDKNGDRTTTTYPGGTVQKTDYDKSSRAQKIEVKNGSTVLSTITYDYNKSGKDTEKINKRTTDGAALAYTYDSKGRLTKAVETKDGSTTAGWAYCYDKASNITGRSTGTDLPACDNAQSVREYNNAGELTSLDGNTGFTYDGDGNETSAASPTGSRSGGQWTPFTQLSDLTASGAASNYTYAGVDNNDRLTRGSSTFTNAATGMTRENSTGFVREASGTLTAMTTGGASQYYLTDVQGSVIGLVDATGKRTATYSYGPYGEARTATGTNQPYRYTGTYLDPSGLYKMGARYYDPQLGRFTQPDPSGQEKNSYLYAAGDPINNTDPSGLLSLGEGLTRAGQAVGLAGALAAPALPLGLGLTAVSAGLEVAGGIAEGKSASDIAGGAVVNLVGGKVGVAADLLKASKTMSRGVNLSYWGMGVAAGEVM
ncbi:RHS repeat-associated core domain-containing protein [Streptomyces sp. ALI-76-A]|uniref:RHS repeat-associated core domain-containing protein n=1 Tax=Streptomyces sp. ALI-76-A TaxID=3025736 RepID=UPI00256EFB02|nr:RHS repeat-associated core domain-containing protein [Streptomyces sp. ALI-76-A]MDL5205354.1 RHS repeat-associated core domain-containing protein [Streptomyces sp. ALI-76-A]